MLPRYLIYNYIKYLTIFLFSFLITIWASQTIRLLEIGVSYNDLFEIVYLTILLIPSYIINIFHLILIFSVFFLNYKFNNTNELFIISQYVKRKLISKNFLVINIIIFLILIVNSEYISQQLYKDYKQKEVELRSEFKVQVQNSKREFKLDDHFVIFFDKFEDDIFFNPKAIIFSDDLLVESENAKITYNDNKINLEFYNGSRVSSSKKEKSITNFLKFNFFIENNSEEIVYPDKESFSVYELLKQDDKKLNVAGHSKIINYIVILIMLINIHRVVNTINLKNQTNYRNLKLLIFLLTFIIVNSFLNKILTLDTINNLIYYCFNIILLILLQLGIWKTYDYS
tara:strand:- start:269 stop:1294 length:1026 start_codon:yes stop_codon:yes gene_type:complete